MKIKDLMFGCRNDTLIGIKSLDHDEVFCFADVDSDEIKFYANRVVLQMSIKQHKFDFIEGYHYKRNYLEVLIAHKEELTIEEAIEVVLADTVGYLPDDLEQLAVINHRVDLLLELKKEKYSCDDLKDLRDFYHRKYLENPLDNDALDRFIVYGQVLSELSSDNLN